MAIITRSVCTLSWIDERTGLPEHDGAGPGLTVNRSQIVGEHDEAPYRFVNLLEATIDVNDRTLAITRHTFTLASKIYRNPSFLGIKSEPFEILRSTAPQRGSVRFRQTVGCRTVSPEVIGESVGAAVANLVLPGAGPIGRRIGRKAAHEVRGFPPIWTSLELDIFADGRSEGRVVMHSLFPSMTFYIPQSGVAATYDRQSGAYDARPNQENWMQHGWGPTTATRGPCSGNPWGISDDESATQHRTD